MRKREEIIKRMQARIDSMVGDFEKYLEEDGSRELESAFDDMVEEFVNDWVREHNVHLAASDFSEEERQTCVVLQKMARVELKKLL